VIGDQRLRWISGAARVRLGSDAPASRPSRRRAERGPPTPTGLGRRSGRRCERDASGRSGVGHERQLVLDRNPAVALPVAKAARAVTVNSPIADLRRELVDLSQLFGSERRDGRPAKGPSRSSLELP